MDDLDSLFDSELASINEVFHQFEVKDKKKEQRILTEQEELKKVKAEVSRVCNLIAAAGIVST